MVRNLEKYTNFQVILYHLHFIFCSLLFIISLFFINPDNYIDTALLYITLLASIFIIVNHRFSMILRMVYISLYAYIAYKHGLRTDVFIKMVFFFPFAMIRSGQLYLTFNRKKWRKIVAKELTIYRNVCNTMGIFYIWCVLGFVGIFMIRDTINDTILNDRMMGSTFYAILILVSFAYLYLDYGRKLNRWTFGIIYNLMVGYMWLSADNISVAIILYLIFWIYYTTVGTIEAIYLREIRRSKSVFSLYLKDIKNYKKK